MCKLNDYELIKFLIERIPSIAFLSDDTKKEYLEKIKQIYEKETKGLIDSKKESLDLIRKIFNPNFIDVLDFWERLLIDALMFLKWNDLSEFPIKDPNNPKYKRPRTTEDAYKKMTEGSLFVFQLKEYFKAFIEFERLLYGAEQFYRDHVYHIIRVWLTGEFILHKFINNRFPIVIFDAKDLRKDILEKKDDSIKISTKSNGLLYEGEEDAIWCLIALTHDLGYPLSKVEKINSSLRKMMSYFVKSGLEEFSFTFPQQNQFINDAILRYLSSKIVRYEKKTRINKNPPSYKSHTHYKTHIQAKFYLKFSQSFERFDHGIISCIALVKNLVYFMETNFDWDDVAVLTNVEEARQFIIRREIMRSIASHTCPEIYHLYPNTFSFLLLLVDELQFWGRPTFESMAIGVHNDYRVTLNEFSDTKVSFDMKPVLGEKSDIEPDSLMNFFLAKVAMFKHILRVAVDSSGRKFTLEFKLQDNKKSIYEFKSPPGIKATTTFNGHNVKYKDFDKLIPLHEKGEKKYEELTELIKTVELFKK
ncbi:MAG: hypothetical protein ACLQF0_09375 [Dissulfurispiraceae bacterium]